MKRTIDDRTLTRVLGVIAIVLVAFLGSYGVALAFQRPAAAGDAGPGPSLALSETGDEIPCACCGVVESEPVEGTTILGEGVQQIDVDLSAGYYQPNIIKAKAGLPIEITFGQGDGCLAEVMFEDFGIVEDLTSGPKTVKLPSLESGEYSFSCGMRMVFGTLVVE